MTNHHVVQNPSLPAELGILLNKVKHGILPTTTLSIPETKAPLILAKRVELMLLEDSPVPLEVRSTVLICYTSALGQLSLLDDSFYNGDTEKMIQVSKNYNGAKQIGACTLDINERIKYCRSVINCFEPLIKKLTQPSV